MEALKKAWYKQAWFIILLIIFSPLLLGILLVLLPFAIFLSPLIFLYFIWAKFKWKSGTKIVVTVMLVVLFLSFLITGVTKTIQFGTQAINDMNKTGEIAVTYIQEGKIDEAKKIIEESKKKFNSNTNPVLKLEEQIQKLESDLFLKNSLVSISEEDLQLLKKGELEKNFIENKKINSLFLEKLNKNIELRTKFLKEIEDETKHTEQILEVEKRTLEAKARMEVLQKQFSTWDGSHIIFSKIIKENLNDPDSFEHVDTSFLDKGDYLIVTMKYRGKNGFGAVMTEYATAKFDIDGNFLGLVE